MTEQEIVNYLKENLNKGVAFGFMPREVQQYITSNFKNLLFLNGNNLWIKTLERQECWKNMIFALPQDFKFEEKPQGEWVEFEINKGKFSYIPSDVNGLDGVIESWWNWQEFLTVSSKFDLGFTAFGGWQYSDTYADKDIWYLYPQIYKESIAQRYASYFGKDTDDVKPAIPIRIRFWKERG